MNTSLTPTLFVPPFFTPSIPSSVPLVSSVPPSRLPLVFHTGTSGTQGLQPAGFLAHRSSSSAFCFHQWTTLLHFCCVSKYLLAFLFLSTPTDVGVFLSAVCVCVFSMYVDSEFPPNTHTPPPATLHPVLSLNHFSHAPSTPFFNI